MTLVVDCPPEEQRSFAVHTLLALRAGTYPERYNDLMARIMVANFDAAAKAGDEPSRQLLQLFEPEFALMRDGGFDELERVMGAHAH